MNIPNMPIGEALERDADGKFTGNLSPTWEMFFRELVTALQGGVSNTGFTIPILPNVTYNQVKIQGNLVFDPVANRLFVNVDGSSYLELATLP